jgi:hypothetical protein
MLQITLKKSSSKRYPYAVDMMLQLGAVAGSGGVVLSVPEHKLLNSYNSLFQLTELIGQWKSVSASFRGKKVPLYRFIYLIYRNISECGAEKTNSKEKEYCNSRYDVPSWGCRLIESLLLYNTGSGNYEHSGIYWYNYGFFDDSGMWIIDKDRIYSRIMKEVEGKALDVCPYFSIAAIEQIVFRDLPDFIIPDNYSYRLHYETVYEGGREIIKAVNIRHISDLSTAPGTDNKRVIYEIRNTLEFLKAIGPDVPEMVKKIARQTKKDILKEGSSLTRAFDKDGMCKN